MRDKPVREAIMRTAARLFYQNGYSNTGINQIIKEAGVAKSTLYQHFRSKEDLLIAYLDEAGTITVDALKQATQKSATPGDKIMSILTFLQELVVRADFYGCQFLNIVYEMPDGEERARVEVKKQKDAIRSLLADILLPMNEPGLADEVYTLIEGALIAHKVHNDTWPVISARSGIRKIF